MNAYLQLIRRNSRMIYAVLLFALSSGVLVYLFPKEGKFQYEFEKGRPWMHANLIAPYDFPVFKTEEELKAERDSLRKNLAPYYRFDSTVVATKSNLFQQNFNEAWKITRQLQDSAIQNNAFVTRLSNDRLNRFYKNNYRKKISEILDFIYARGILEFMPFGDDDQQASSIRVIRGNTSKKTNINQIFTLKSAYSYIFNQLSKSTHLSDNGAQEEMDFIRALNLNTYLQPNLIFDAETTQKAKEARLNNVSLTSGLVQKGERIIFRGEVVTQDKLKILNSLKRQYETSLVNSQNRHFIILGHIIFISFLLFTLLVFMRTFREDIIMDTGKTVFILLMVILFTSVSIFVLNYPSASLNIIPYAILPITIRMFYDTRLALFVHFITILIIGFLAPNGFEFILMQFSAGIVSIISLKNLTRRSQLFITGGIVIATYSLVYFALAIIHEGSLETIEWRNFLFFSINGFMLLFTYPLIYMLEKAFGFLSDVSLIELADTNNKLLKELSEKAPGTFQHSIMVGNLAEEAVNHIGGHSLLVRVGALYHDIGKMEEPYYFIENQRMGVNLHDNLDYDESAEIIISHVSRGVKMAQKHNLPKPIIDFIKTHHGTNRVLYFYRSYKNKYPDEPVDISKFTYPGPKPFSKETAVLMMADSIEAASRSLKVIDENSINDLVENIINSQIDNKQFTNSDITFKDISTIKEVFKNKMKNVYHARIEYPKEEKQPAATKA